MSTFNKVCYSVCVTAIALMVGLGLLAVWGCIDSDVAWKSFVSLVIIAGGAGATAGVNSAFGVTKDPPAK